MSAYASPEECEHCLDLGVVRVVSHDEPFETLMLCNCKEGQAQRYRLPRWEWSLGKLFARQRCPVSWFKPEMSVDAITGKTKFKESMEHKVRYWSAKVKIAELYWAHASTQQGGTT